MYNDSGRILFRSKSAQPLARSCQSGWRVEGDFGRIFLNTLCQSLEEDIHEKINETISRSCLRPPQQLPAPKDALTQYHNRASVIQRREMGVDYEYLDTETKARLGGNR